jgi:parallel beta-helix repeat protein
MRPPALFRRNKRNVGAPSSGARFARVLVAAVVAVVVLIPGAVGAGALSAGTTLFVDQANPNCSDTGTGSSIQPFCTITAAASHIAPGDTVQVASGTYSERVVAPSGTSDAPVVFTAAPGATVTVGTGQVNGFVAAGKSWVTINGFNVTQTSSYGIDVSSAASNVTISNNHVSYAGQPVSGLTRFGIRISGATNSIITGNTVDHNSDSGIAVVSSSTGIQVLNNHTFANARGFERAATGIRIYQSPNNTVAGNLSHDNEDSGIECYAGANNTLVYNNVTFNNGDHGIDNLTATGQRIIANTVYKNVTAGINVEGTSTGATLANNISVDNGINSPRTKGNIRIEAGSTAGTTMDYDLVYLTTPATLLIWNSVNYSSLAAFQSASGQEAHGLQADPKWTSPAGGDFHLLAGSPAIDSADSGVTGQPSLDVEGHPRLDDPATPNSGAGPRPYDDRGAYEFQAGPSPDGPPLAQLTTAPTSGNAPLAVTADSSASTDADATPIASYSFEFGDGSAPIGPQPGPTATHTYTATGTYTVTVTVTDTAGLSSTATASVQVTAGGQDAAPAAALTVSPPSGTINLAVTADASASTDADATPIASYSFEFGDGSAPIGPQPGPTATHTYTATGTYTVTVTVTDTAGLSATASSHVIVTDAAPTARLSVKDSGLSVIADASASTDADATPIASYSFDFGDGSAPIGPQPGPTATHTYTATRTYTVTVTVTVTDTAGLSSTDKRKIKFR